MLHKALTAILFFASMQITMGQIITNDLFGKTNYLEVAVPFLTIPQSPSINGVITSVPNGTSGPGIYGNPGLLALDHARFQATIDYSPWYRNLTADMNLYSMGGSYRLNDKHTIGMNFRLFTWGSIIFSNTSGASTQFNPTELAGTLFYTYNIDPLTGIGVGVKYISSKLFSGDTLAGFKLSSARSFAADLGFAKQFPGKNGKLDHFLGISLKNVGTKIHYTQNSDEAFIPITLTAGYGIRVNLKEQQSISVSYEVSKLLVPTPPLYYIDSLNLNGDPVIVVGFDPNVGVFRGMIQSFYDAPGGYREEIREITHSLGIIYNYRFISAGLGYFRQDPTKGGNQFFTVGLSGRFDTGPAVAGQCRVNIAYIIPAYKNSAIGNTLQFGLNLSI